MERIKIYDNPTDNDRYTVVFFEQKQSNGLFSAIGANNYPTHPLGFYQHTDCALGSHLGNRVSFKSLSVELKKLITIE